ncbi:MAG TPA: hypothetical protein VFC38_01195 [Stellaceae bacterium]|nr:hypothetical protein [Stellaceae bacterium]
MRASDEELRRDHEEMESQERGMTVILVVMFIGLVALIAYGAGAGWNG